MNIIFWNTNRKKDCNKNIVNLIKQNNCDIIVLAEYCDDKDKLINELYYSGDEYKTLKKVDCKKIDIILKSEIKINANIETYNYIGCCVKRGKFEFELFATHLASQMFASMIDRLAPSRELKCDIDRYKNAVVVGDFNSNPFDTNMMGVSHLSALPNKKCPERIFQKMTYKSLYNPMWKFFGDFEDFPGTYYCNNGKEENYYWYIFDQVLLSKNIVKDFDKSSLKIIQKINEINLIKNGKIDTDISDHLPIFFSLKEEEK